MCGPGELYRQLVGVDLLTNSPLLISQNNTFVEDEVRAYSTSRGGVYVKTTSHQWLPLTSLSDVGVKKSATGGVNNSRHVKLAYKRSELSSETLLREQIGQNTFLVVILRIPELNFTSKIRHVYVCKHYHPSHTPSLLIAGPITNTTCPLNC